MNATTTVTVTASRPLKSEGAFRRMLRTVGAELRRGLELANQKYTHGMLPPL